MLNTLSRAKMRTTMFKPFHCLVALLALLASAPTVHADEKAALEPYEAWFVVKIGEHKAGHMHVTFKQDGDTITSTSAMQLAIKRGPAEMVIEQSSEFVETLDHKPISASSLMKMSQLETKQRLDFAEEKWTLTTTTAGQANTVEVDTPEEKWLPPGALAVVFEQAMRRGDKSISATTLDLSMGPTPFAITMVNGGEANVEVFGKVVPATKWTTTMDAMPGIEIEQWMDASGQPVRQTIPMLPGMEMEMLLADQALALADFDAPEMLAASLIKPDQALKNPRKLKRAVFELVAKGLKENVGETIPNDGYQQSQWIDDNTLQITLDLAKTTTDQQAKPNEVFLASPSMLNHEDEVIQALVHKAIDVDGLASAQSPKSYEAALKRAAYTSRDFVHEYIDAKDLSVGFASASETARTKQGDCTEHACLLAAMLRGIGIPSRTVTGLVYADQFAGHEGVFGFHMWTQAWVQTSDKEGYWLDLDAAMPGQVDGFDATHIALSTSAMQDSESFNDMVTLLPLMQGIKIKIIELDWMK